MTSYLESFLSQKKGVFFSHQRIFSDFSKGPAFLSAAQRNREDLGFSALVIQTQDNVTHVNILTSDHSFRFYMEQNVLLRRNA